MSKQTETIKEFLLDAYKAGFESVEYADRCGVPMEDCLDQWVEYKFGCGVDELAEWLEGL